MGYGGQQTRSPKHLQGKWRCGQQVEKENLMGGGSVPEATGRSSRNVGYPRELCFSGDADWYRLQRRDGEHPLGRKIEVFVKLEGFPGA